MDSIVIFAETPSDILKHQLRVLAKAFGLSKGWPGLSSIIQNQYLRSDTDFVFVKLYDRERIASPVRHFSVVGAYGFGFALFERI